MIDVVEGPTGWELHIANQVIIASVDKSVCEHWARIFSTCRNQPYRVALKTLIDGLGLSEDSAKRSYSLLFEYNSSTTVQ